MIDGSGRGWRSPVRALALLLVLTPMLSAIIATPRTGLAAAPARWFWYQHAGTYIHVPCERLATGPHVQIYAPRSAHVPAQNARFIAELFESRVYPIDTANFGLPRRLNPVIVLLVPLDAMTLGYFDPNDTAPAMLMPDPQHSNRANVLYVRLPATMPDRDKLADTGEVLAHELQHLIEYRLRVVDRHSPMQDDWLNEGFSFYAQLASGFWTPRDELKVQAAIQQPSWPVTALFRGTGFLRRYARLAYGRAGMFATYLASRFGTTLIHDILNSNQVGMSAVDAALRLRDRHLDAPSVFADWSVAQVLDSGRRYGYGEWSRQLRASPSLVAGVTESYPWDSRVAVPGCICLHPWGQAYVGLATARNGDLRATFSGSTEHLRVAAILRDSTGEVPTKVEWLTFRHGHLGDYMLDGFGGLYNRITFAVSNVGPDSSSADIRLRVQLDNLSDNNRMMRSTATAGNNVYLTVG